MGLQLQVWVADQGQGRLGGAVGFKQAGRGLCSALQLTLKGGLLLDIGISGF